MNSPDCLIKHLTVLDVHLKSPMLCISCVKLKTIQLLFVCLDSQKLIHALRRIRAKMASSLFEWSLVPVSNCVLTDRAVQVYSYFNHDLDAPATVWVSDTNRVIFQSQHGFTPWHGWFVIDMEGTRLRAMLDCYGRDDCLKSVQALRISEGKWTGYDYANRQITITFRETKRYCRICEAYHVTERP